MKSLGYRIHFGIREFKVRMLTILNLKSINNVKND